MKTKWEVLRGKSDVSVQCLYQHALKVRQRFSFILLFVRRHVGVESDGRDAFCGGNERAAGRKVATEQSNILRKWSWRVIIVRQRWLKGLHTNVHPSLLNILHRCHIKLWRCSMTKHLQLPGLKFPLGVWTSNQLAFIWEWKKNTPIFNSLSKSFKLLFFNQPFLF